MPLRPLADVSPAEWFVEAKAPWWTKVCLGPPGFEAYARLQLVPDLTLVSTEALRRILPDHTTTSDDCYFGQWEGCGWEPPVPPEPHTISLLGELAPGQFAAVRDYHLFSGALEDSREWDGGDPPHLMWPADHAWFVAKDVDPDWIGVAGTQTLIDEVLAVRGLDAAPSAYDAADWESR